MSKSKKNIQNIVIIGVFTAFVSIISSLPIGIKLFGVPATLQTFAIAFTGFVLGRKNGTTTIFIYILIGITGIPVFNGFNGGSGVLLGVTGGFIIGFLFLCFFSGFGMKFSRIYIRIPFALLGLLLCHILGSIAAGIYLEMSPWKAALVVSFPYIPKDILSVFLAYFLAVYVKKALVKAQINL